MATLLSVVIPYFNVESYIAECLRSVAGQSVSDIEAILVDDGSSDSSVAVASDFVRRDRRFVLHNQDNGGLGAARNAGAALATGKYLTFVDSDDMVTQHGYGELISAMERSGSDFAAGDAYRLTPDGAVPYRGFKATFGRTALRTHIADFPSLVTDRMIWNKVFRRSFWCRQAFRFPGGLYEDAAIALSAHCRADAVDLIGEPVYYWRYRESGDSITQRRYELANLLDRARMVAEAGRIVASCSAAVKRAYDLEMCSGYDVRLLVLAVEHAPEPRRTEPLRSILTEYLRTVSPRVIAGLDGPHQTRIRALIHPVS